jgi:hypothetical protein
LGVLEALTFEWLLRDFLSLADGNLIRLFRRVRYRCVPVRGTLYLLAHVTDLLL